MSKKNNVNPDYYRISGRDKQGEDILREVHKQKNTQAQPQGNPQESFFPTSPPMKQSSKDGETNKPAETGK